MKKILVDNMFPVMVNMKSNIFNPGRSKNLMYPSPLPLLHKPKCAIAINNEK
jgi:hypothetical protein